MVRDSIGDLVTSIFITPPTIKSLREGYILALVIEMMYSRKRFRELAKKVRIAEQVGEIFGLW